MKSTTIKVGDELLEKLNAIKPSDMSVSGYVRNLIEKDIRQRKLAEAADQYQAFLTANPQERKWLAEWDAADLTSAPKRASP